MWRASHFRTAHRLKLGSNNFAVTVLPVAEQALARYKPEYADLPYRKWYNQ
jgi:hypothetical protein